MMNLYAGIEARLTWALLFSGGEGLLKEEHSVDYDGLLEGMDAAQLLELVKQAKRRLNQLEDKELCDEAEKTLYISKDYHIRLDGPMGIEIPFRPLVRALFILFLRHPEGILLKDRDRFRRELEVIYSVTAPSVSSDARQKRIQRLMDPMENAFSENLSVLNATLERVILSPMAEQYKVHGYNGSPRKIVLSPLRIHWE